MDWKLWILAGVVLFGGVLAVGAYLGAWDFPLTIPSGSKFVLEPQYGHYECEHWEGKQFMNLPASDQGGWWEQNVFCPANGNNCRIGAKVCCYGILCGAGHTYVEFRKINYNGVWGPEEQRKVNFNHDGDCQEVWYGDFLTGEGLHIGLGKGGVGAETKFYGMLTYDAYRLVQEPHNGGKYIINQVSCTMPLTRTKRVQDQIVPEICVAGCEDWGKVNKPSGQNTLDFGEVWNYLGGYNLAPDGMAINDPQDNELVYCQQMGAMAKLRTLKIFSTESTTYYVPDLDKRDVECCPGMTYLGKSCNSNLEWDTAGEWMCDMFGTVSSCPGSGGYVIDPRDEARQTIMHAIGCDGLGICIMETLQVECTSNSQCPPNRPSCINWVCVDVDPPPWRPTCGNGICETGENDPNTDYYCPADCEILPDCGDGVCNLGEDWTNCPSDCPQPFPDITFLWIVIIGILGAAIGFAIGGKIGAVIGMIIGGIIGYGVYWFMNLPWWAQLLLGIFGVAGSGILIYVMLFGGGAIAALALYAAVKK